MHGTLRTAPHPDGRTGCGAALGLRDAPVGTLSHPSAICWRGWPSDPTRRGRRGPRVGAVGGRGRRRPSLPGEGVREGTARRRPRRDLPELGGCRPRCRARTRLRLGVGADPVDGLQLPVAGTVVLARVLSENNDLPPPSGHIAVGWLVVKDLRVAHVGRQCSHIGVDIVVLPLPRAMSNLGLVGTACRRTK